MLIHLSFSRFRPLAAAAALAACAAAVTLPALRAQEISTLALPDRRGVKQYQDNKFPELQKEIKAAAGFDVPMEVKWGAIAKPGEGESYSQDDYWTNIYFKPLVAALKKVTADPMGAEAIKTKLKKIVITYDKDNAPVSVYGPGVKFEDGTLTINFEPYSNSSDIEPRTKAIADGLEAKL